MYEIGQKVIDKQTNEVCRIAQICYQFYIIMFKNGITVGRFSWELEKYSFIKRILRKVGRKNGRK